MTETELNALLAGITPANEAARAAAHAHWASLAKPLGGLGRLETMLEDAAALTGSAELDLSRRVVVVLCADNGVVAQGVSQTGQEVTRAVAENLAMRRTSVCQMARTAHCDVLPVDMGMAGEPVPGVRSCRIAAGTADFTQGPAMSRAEAVQAVGEGIALARELAEQTFAPLSVLLIEREALPSRRTPGLPDEAFIRGAVPMTKQEVRAAALAKLAVAPTDILWDVGAGTGSVSVELALAAPAGQVYAVECDPEACALIQQNREKFAAYNLTLIEGKAPEALDMLPAPDAVFIGGTKGNMDAVVDAVLHKNPAARLCITAIALETLSAAVTALTAHGLSAEVTQIAVNRTKTAGSLHLLMANNPVFLITGARA